MLSAMRLLLMPPAALMTTIVTEDWEVAIAITAKRRLRCRPDCTEDVELQPAGGGKARREVRIAVKFLGNQIVNFDLLRGPPGHGRSIFLC